LDLHLEKGLKDFYSWLTRILNTIGKLGLKNGALPTLINLMGFGTGVKGGIDSLKNRIAQVKSKVDLNVTEAEQKAKELT